MPCGFDTYSELGTYLSCLWLGTTVLLTYNTFLSVPNYAQNYYRLTQQSWDVTSPYINFWDHYLSITTFITMLSALVGQAFNLTPLARRLSQHSKLVACAAVIAITLALFPIISCFHVSQLGTMIFAIVDAGIASAATGVFSSTCIGFAAALPPKFMSATFIGVGVSGVLTSVLGVIAQGSFPLTLAGQKSAGGMFFGITAGMEVVSLVVIYFLQHNSFAHQYTTEFRIETKKRSSPSSRMIEDGENSGIGTYEGEQTSGEEDFARPLITSLDAEGNVVTDDNVVTHNSSKHNNRESDHHVGGTLETRREAESTDSNPVVTAAVSSEYHTTTAPPPVAASTNKGEEEKDLLDEEQHLKHDTATANVFEVFVVCFPMVFTTCLSLCLSCIIFPGVITAHSTSWTWFEPLAMLVYSIAMAVGCSSTNFECLRLPRKYVIWTGLVRGIILMPMAFFNVTKPHPLIPGTAYPIVIAGLTGITDGYFASLAPIYAPSSEGLKTEKQRNLTGNLCDFAVLLGCSMGSCFGAFVNTQI